MYFSNFPKITYAFKIGNTAQLRIVRDIVANVRARKDLLGSITIYDEYDIQEGETPEKIANKFYGNPNYHWVIMLINERYNMIEDFPLSEQDFESYITQKYGDNPATRYEQHTYFGSLHYETPDGQIVDSDNELAQPVSNYDYELHLNESKRRIKLVSARYIDQIADELEALFVSST
jgi:hypothetical protein